MNNLIVPQNGLGDMESVAGHFVRSGFFKDARDVSQAVVKIMAGREVGLESFAAMSGVQIIQGKACFGASTLAALVQRSGKYRFRVNANSAECCSIEFFEKADSWASVGTSEFTMADAQRAQLLSNPTWQKYPKAMLYARAMSQGVRMFCPEVGCGPVYVPEELALPGAQIGEDGEVLDAEVLAPAPVAASPAPVSAPGATLDPAPVYPQPLAAVAVPAACTKAQIVKAWDDRAAMFGSRVKRSALIRKLAGEHAIPDSDTASATLELPDATWQRAVEEANWEMDAANVEPDPQTDFEPVVKLLDEDPTQDGSVDVDPFEVSGPVGLSPAAAVGPAASQGDIDTMYALAARAGVEPPDASAMTAVQVKAQTRNYSSMILQANAEAAKQKRAAK